MLIGTAAGVSNLATVALSVTLAFVFGYGLTSLPLLRAGFALSAVVPIALASDALSIATMEIVDNAIVLAVPGAMESGLGSLLSSERSPRPRSSSAPRCSSPKRSIPTWAITVTNQPTLR